MTTSREGAAALIQPCTATRAAAKHPASAVAGAVERLALVAGDARPCAARVLAELARELTGCEAAVVLVPGGRGQSLDVAAVDRARPGGPVPGESWTTGPLTHELCARQWASAQARSGESAALHEHLRAAGLTSWQAMPLAGGDGRPSLGLLVLGSRGRPSVPGRLDLLAPLAASGAVVLARAHPAGAWYPDPEHLRRVRLLAALAFGVSHSLGNTFSSMVGNLHFLREMVTAPEPAELVAQVERSAAAGAELMQALQAISALPAEAEMGPMDLSEVACEVAGLVGAVCAPWPGLAELMVGVDGEEPCSVWGNRAQLREALLRLLFNAAQSMASPGHVMLETGGATDRAWVTVRDDGPGMSPEVARRACEPFFTTRPAPHQGLGLTIVRGIAVAHRGALKLERAPGGGAQVTLTVSRERPDNHLEAVTWLRRNRLRDREGPTARKPAGVAP